VQNLGDQLRGKDFEGAKKKVERSFQFTAKERCEKNVVDRAVPNHWGGRKGKSWIVGVRAGVLSGIGKGDGFAKNRWLGGAIKTHKTSFKKTGAVKGREPPPGEAVQRGRKHQRCGQHRESNKRGKKKNQRQRRGNSHAPRAGKHGGKDFVQGGWKSE